MGPISQGTVDSLAALAGVVKVIQNGGAQIFEDLKAQMDDIVAKGAEVSEREARLFARETAVAEAETRWNSAMERIAGKEADVTKRLETANRKLATVTAAQEAVEGAQAEFNANATKLSAELTERDVALDAKADEIDRLWAAANDAKQEYEAKLTKLRSITE